MSKTVTEILNNVKANGDAALREYSAKFDKTTVAALQVSEAEIAAAGERLSDELKQAMAVAVKNIETFHNAQQLQAVDVETLPGVRCQQVTRPIASVGLYIPGGSAPLFSTVLMLATPARIAGCQQVVLCSPPPIADEILYAAQLCGVKTIFNVGGAQAIAALGLTSETVRTAITSANVNSAKGSLDGPARAVTLSANDQMQSAEDYRRLIIAYQNGAPIRLGDVASVEQGAENSWLGAWANQQRAIVMNVQRQPGANIIDTADSIRQMLPQLTESLPKSVKVQVLSDRTTNIRASVRDTQFELMLAIALVVMIIYLFLRNVPATIIPGVAVPLSLVGTFAVMVFLDFSINNLTLMALTIATGFVVDDAIVVIEN
ncbi:hypothetical protein CWN02_15150, partial [Klebsiella pneumoniae]